MDFSIPCSQEAFSRSHVWWSLSSSCWSFCSLALNILLSFSFFSRWARQGPACQLNPTGGSALLHLLQGCNSFLLKVETCNVRRCWMWTHGDELCEEHVCRKYTLSICLTAWIEKKDLYVGLQLCFVTEAWFPVVLCSAFINWSMRLCNKHNIYQVLWTERCLFNDIFFSSRFSGLIDV